MGTFVHSNLQFLHQINTKQTIKLTMSSSLLSFVLLCIVFVHSATAQDLESSKKYDKALDSKDKGYGMDAPTYNGYKTKDLDSKDDGYKNKDYKEYRYDPSDPYARYYKTDSGLDSKDSEYEMRSILNGYKNKDYKKNDKNGKDLYKREYFNNDPYKREYFNNDPYKREYFNNPYKREYFNNGPYKREYRGPCCSGWELDGALCYPQCASGFNGIGPVCWRGFDSYGRGAGAIPWSSC